MSGIESIDFLAPGGKGRNFVLYGPLTVGNVVDFSAKRIDRVHRVPAVFRQQAHRPIKRGSGRLDAMTDRLKQHRVARPFSNGA
jgi:hypothetical protein